MNLLILIWQRRKAIQNVSALALAKLAQEGVAVKNFRKTWVQRAVSCKSDSYLWFVGNYYARQFAALSEDSVAAAQLLEECLQWAAHLRPEVRSELARAACITQAWDRNNLEKARVWLERIRPVPAIGSLQRIHLEIVTSVAANDRDCTREYWDQAIYLIQNMDESATKADTLKAWQRWKAEIDRRFLDSTTPSASSARNP
jgi:hypothetical protein